jgi:hypothetical protein
MNSPGTTLVRRTRTPVPVDRLRAAERRCGAVAVQAPAVTWRGEVIVLPGPVGPGSGSRTLLSALVAAGAGLLATEYVLIRENGAIVGFPVPEPLTGLPLTLVAELAFSPQDGWNVRPSSGGHTVLTLVDRALDTQSRSRRVMDHVLAAVPGSTAVTGTRGEADDAARRILGSWRRGG